MFQGVLVVSTPLSGETNTTRRRGVGLWPGLPEIRKVV
jgi:hypothetical protein